MNSTRKISQAIRKLDIEQGQLKNKLYCSGIGDESERDVNNE